MKLSRREIVFSAIAASLLASSSAHALLFSGANPSSPSPGTLLKTVTVENTSGGATAANSHTPSFGLLFKKGDVPSGTWPILKTAGGATIPYTYWNRSSWSDGSIRILPVLSCFPDAVSGSSTADIKVYNGGSAQSASNRTLSEVYAENITVVGAGGLNNISGDWTCDLQAANVLETVVYGDGPAGKVWRLLCNFNQSGSPHGQLVTYFYLMALQNPNGSLAGFRILPRVTQPWYNVDSPAKFWRSFTSLTLQYGSGPTIINPMDNYSAHTFTWANSGDQNSICNSTAHGYTTGVACRLTTTGTLPAGLSTNTTYWVKRQNDNTLYIGDNSSEGGNVVVITSAGSGTHTINPIPYLVHFGTYWGTETEKFAYFQGAGSVAAEATLRIQADIEYDHETKTLPPYDMSIGTVTSNDDWNPAPYQCGPLTLHISGTGERDDIGVLNSYHARHFYTQAAVDEKLARIIGLCQAMLPNAFRDVTTKNYANFSANSYTGMPASAATTITWRPTNSQANAGFTAPGGTVWTQCFSGTDDSHQTQYSAYPYIITGEPQYYDLLAEVALQSNCMQSANQRNFTVGSNDYKGIGPAGKDTFRTGAWAYRDIVWAGILAPDVAADGSQASDYNRDLAALQSTYMVDWKNAQSSWYITNGYWFPQSNDNGRSSWQVGYLWASTCVHASDDTNALEIATHLSKWPPFVKTLTGSLWCLATYYEVSSSDANTNGSPLIDTDNEWGPWSGAANLSWTISGNLFTWDTPNWTPANGDKIMFWAIARPGSNFSYNTQYYAVNLSGNNCQFSATPGGSPITVQSNDSLGGSWPGQICFPQFAITIIPANPPSTGYVQGSVDAAGYGANQLGCINWALALGMTTTGLAACSTELTTRQSGVNYTPNPKYCMQPSF